MKRTENILAADGRPKACLLDFSLEEMTGYLEEIGERPYRARQVYSWIYRKYADTFTDMTDLSHELQARLRAASEISRMSVANELHSPASGARKFLFELPDGSRIETVYIPDGTRRTVCVSSQAGCALKCSFCATGITGFQRNLSAGEIVDQVLTVSRAAGQSMTNVVFMGMGEPFLNYDNVIKAARIINDDRGLGIGARHIAISTAGILDRMVQFYREKHKFKLALSLNAGTEEVRRRIMPVSRKFPLAGLKAAIQAHHRKNMHPVTIEYVLMAGVNDSGSEIDALLSFVKGLPAKVNLIPHNPVSGAFSPPDDARVNAIFEKIRSSHVQVNVRRSAGGEIRAACGQLCVPLR